MWRILLSFGESESDEEISIVFQTPPPVEGHEEINPLIMKAALFICTFLLSWQAIFRLTDSALNVLFKFLSIIFLKLSFITKSKDIKNLHKVFPGSLTQARVLRNIDTNCFTKLIVCGKCHSTYQYGDCFGESDTNNLCKFIRFPHHPQKRMCSPCLFPLLKIVKTSTGKYLSVPLKIFCYKSLINALEQLVQKPHIFDTLNHWKTRNIPLGIMADTYDGAV